MANKRKRIRVAEMKEMFKEFDALHMQNVITLCELKGETLEQNKHLWESLSWDRHFEEEAKRDAEEETS